MKHVGIARSGMTSQLHRTKFRCVRRCQTRVSGVLTFLLCFVMCLRILERKQKTWCFPNKGLEIREILLQEFRTCVRVVFSLVPYFPRVRLLHGRVDIALTNAKSSQWHLEHGMVCPVHSDGYTYTKQMRQQIPSLIPGVLTVDLLAHIRACVHDSFHSENKGPWYTRSEESAVQSRNIGRLRKNRNCFATSG